MAPVFRAAALARTLSASASTSSPTAGLLSMTLTGSSLPSIVHGQQREFSLSVGAAAAKMAAQSDLEVGHGIAIWLREQFNLLEDGGLLGLLTLPPGGVSLSGNPCGMVETRAKGIKNYIERMQTLEEKVVWTTAELRRSAERLQLLDLSKDTSFQPPKRPTPAYALFYKEKFATTKIFKTGADKDKVDVVATSKALAAAWKNLSEGAKKSYYDRYEALRDQYDRKLDEFESKKTPEDYAKEQVGNMYFLVPLPYMRWAAVVQGMSDAEQRAMFAKSFADMPISERGKTMGARWRLMTEAEKATYQKAFEVERDAYKRARLAFESKMAPTRQDLVDEVSEEVRERRAKVKVAKKKSKPAKKAGGRRTIATKRRSTAARTAARKKPAAKKATRSKTVPAAKKATVKAPVKKTAVLKAKKAPAGVKRTVKKVVKRM
ncbi:hypothetical protein HDU93_008335 [Gonapodya sp. JEL0774]|nr:hypothetical protein HDU93_008335 [Gonapodya sp. JEL0774]